MRPLRPAAGAIAVALAASAAAASRQDPPQPVFRAGIEYVEVDVVVTDEADRIVRDLTAADFEIRQDGRRQTIADFRFVSIPPARRTIAVGTAAPAADVATNVAAPGGRTFVLLIDDLHILAHHVPPVRQVLLDFLRALTPDDQVAVVFVGRSDLGVGFTNDAGALARAADRIREAVGFGVSPVNEDAMDATSRLPHARSAVWTLKNVTTAMAASTHPRRTVVFVSGGVSLGPGEQPPLTRLELQDALLVFEELEDVYEAARRANVRVYTLDPRGLVTPETAVRSGLTLERAASVAHVARRIRVQHDYLSAIALNTGGRAALNRSNLTEAIEEIVAENGSFYLLGYYPDPFRRDGKFHAIDVTVKRPDLRVRARQGYVAPPATSTKAAAAATLDTALGLALPVPGLTLRAAVTPLAAGPRGRTTAAVTLHVGYAAPDAGATRVKDELQYGLVAIEADGRVLASSRRAFSFELPLRQRGEVEYRINDAIDLPPGALTVRVGAASVAAGRAGTVHLPLVVPDFAAGRVEVSGLVIGLAGASESPASRFEAIAALTPIQPTAERTFTAADTLQVFARIFLPKDANERVDARLVVKRGDEVVRSESMAVESGRVDGRATADCGVELPLDGLSPGAYILEVTASAGNPAVRATAFQIQ